ncbi:hypothetical protein GCM10025865_31110 [Paraoerskovia sediminicola]|uniref:Sporulation protein YtfJ (Spore_YtfJ) n=1 Tax=Paraoerskovia sediminicola TaxID=1138587 RepID=A0ABM8G6L4_9CELL|nr:hypothetical protein [Paraoerskovia sediminicola]BDZ43812.1 hypothetical protein GCM10025865_31110 [Paraoerskovia sediminicola]
MTEDTRTFSPDLSRLTDAADSSFSVRRAFGEPYEHQGTLLVPVAKVWGATGTGSGGGTGSGTGAGSGSGTGSGNGSGNGGSPFSFSRRVRVGSHSDDGPGAEAADSASSTATDSAADPSTRGGANGEARGEANGEARGEANGEAHGEGGGGGGGYGLRVKALGVYAISPTGDVRWQPALDLNRVLVGGQAVAAVAAVALGWALGRRRR